MLQNICNSQIHNVATFELLLIQINFKLMLYVQVNNFSVMLEQTFRLRAGQGCEFVYLQIILDHSQLEHKQAEGSFQSEMC